MTRSGRRARRIARRLARLTMFQRFEDFPDHPNVRARRWLARNPSSELIMQVAVCLVNGSVPEPYPAGSRLEERARQSASRRQTLLLLFDNDVMTNGHMRAVMEHVSDDSLLVPSEWWGDPRMPVERAARVLLSAATNDTHAAASAYATRHPGVPSVLTQDDWVTFLSSPSSMLAEWAAATCPADKFSEQMYTIVANRADRHLYKIAGRLLVSHDHRTRLTLEHWQRLLDGAPEYLQEHVALMPDVPADVYMRLASSMFVSVRFAVAQNPAAPEEARVVAALNGVDVPEGPHPRVRSPQVPLRHAWR